MATEALKTTVITNLDATPIVRPTEGGGAGGFVRKDEGFITPTSGVTSGSTYRLVRVPSNARVKEIITEGAAMSAGAFDFGVYYSSAVNDGTAAANTGLVIDADFFATAVSFASAVTPTNVTNESGTYTIDKRGKQL